MYLISATIAAPLKKQAAKMPIVYVKVKDERLTEFINILVGEFRALGMLFFYYIAYHSFSETTMISVLHPPTFFFLSIYWFRKKHDSSLWKIKFIS